MPFGLSVATHPSEYNTEFAQIPGGRGWGSRLSRPVPPLRLQSTNSQISSSRVMIVRHVFCGTEAGAAGRENTSLGDIKVLDLTRSANEWLRYRMRYRPS